MQYFEIPKICYPANVAFDEKSALSAFVLGKSRPHIPIDSFQE